MKLKYKYYPALFALIIFSNTMLAQQVDSTLTIDRHNHDSVYTICENVPKSKAWGNSTYLSFGYNWNRSHEFDFNIGRTYGKSFCSGGGCIFTARSWGVGVGLSKYKGDTNPLLKAFWELGVFYFPPYSAAVRAEYIYDINNGTHYIRPSAGFSLLFLDVLYNYSFKVGGQGPNLFRHGVSFRVKYFRKTKNWQKNRPSEC